MSTYNVLACARCKVFPSWVLAGNAAHGMTHRLQCPECLKYKECVYIHGNYQRTVDRWNAQQQMDRDLQESRQRDIAQLRAKIKAELLAHLHEKGYECAYCGGHNKLEVKDGPE